MKALLLALALFAPALHAESLDDYLIAHGCPEGVTVDALTFEQEDQYIDCLIDHPEISRVAQIGFGAGHVADLFFALCHRLESFVAFDAATQPYVSLAANHLSSYYPAQLTLISGNPLATVPAFMRKSSNQRFDLVYITGSSDITTCLRDIVHGRQLARPNALLWIDNYTTPAVQKAVEICQQRGVFRLIKLHTSTSPASGEHTWVEASYMVH